MKITKQQLEQIIREELNEIRIKIPLPQWTSKFMKGAPEEEPLADDGPRVLDKIKQALSTDITPDSWKYDPYAERPERPLTAAEKRERAEKEKRDLRSQEIGKQKEAEREKRKAEKRAEMGITKEQLKQFIKEELAEYKIRAADDKEKTLVNQIVNDPETKVEKPETLTIVKYLNDKGYIKWDHSINEIAPSTKIEPGGFKGILQMVLQATAAIDNLEHKFDEPPEEIYTIQKYLEGIEKAAKWQMATHEFPTAARGMDPDEYKRMQQKAHTVAYKRDLD